MIYMGDPKDSTKNLELKHLVKLQDPKSVYKRLLCSIH